MRGTLSLMSMIVNRCTGTMCNFMQTSRIFCISSSFFGYPDVFAASDGSELVPNSELFAFAPSVAKVCRAVSDMQSRIPIDAYFSPDLGSEVYTDKRWFEDNLLCLLSNAAKFSRESTGVGVDVRVLKSSKLDTKGQLRKMVTIEVSLPPPSYPVLHQ